jgi:hypothetical protein
MLALNEAVARRLAFGKDIIFTFGPYGSVYSKSYHPATDAQMLWAAGLVAMAIACGLISLTVERHRWRAVLLTAFLGAMRFPDPILLATALIFLAVVCRIVLTDSPDHSRPASAAIVFSLLLLPLALGLLILIKGTFAAASLTSMGLGGLALMFCGKWRLAITLGFVFVGSVPVYWILAHQDLADLPAYFAAMGQIISGYNEAMALQGPLWQPALYLVVSLSLLLLYLGRVRAMVSGEVALLAGAGFVLFLGFKAGFIRQDLQ